MSASGQVKLVVSGLGHVPALKNSMYSIVDKKNREWKRRCVRSFVAQFLSACPTFEFATLTPDAQRFWTALLGQSPKFDDNWKVIAEIHLTVELVKRGDEGAEVTLSLMDSVAQKVPDDQRERS